MKKIDKHAPGSFCWIELGTSDQNAAKNFYMPLFGWEADDRPMGPSEFYTMFKLQGREVGAAYTLTKEMKGVPPHWMVYIAVENADASAKRAEQLGGKICKGAFDVFDVGRMAVLQDPAGAMFCVWQAKTHSGIEIAGVDGTMCWADLNTPDREKAEKFYSGVFGWKIMKEDEEPAHAYYHIKNGEEFIGGMPPPMPMSKKIPPHWLVYFLTHECDKYATKAKELGAKFLMEPITMEDVGRFGVLSDPQGAAFAIFQPKAR